MVTPGACRVVKDPQHARLTMHPYNGLLTALDRPSQPHLNNSSPRRRD